MSTCVWIQSEKKYMNPFRCAVSVLSFKFHDMYMIFSLFSMGLKYTIRKNIFKIIKIKEPLDGVK